MPGISDVFVQVETLDLSQGLTWRLTVRDPAGDVPTLSCIGDSTFGDSDASCSVDTVIDGNVLDGSFVVAGSDSLPYDVTAMRLASALAENVCRSS